MNQTRAIAVCLLVALAVGLTAVTVQAGELALRGQDAAGGTMSGGNEWTLSGPYHLRSADPEEPGELELKFIYTYERTDEEDDGCWWWGDGDDDDDHHEIEFVLEWGIAEDWEFIMELPVTIGEGSVEGNGDIAEFGFHTRFWKEDGWLPAFAMRNLIRIPTGYKSDGVDYTARGLFTSTIIPGTMRLHFNPFITFVNGNDDEGDRNRQCGAALGFDYRVSDDLLFIADYRHTTGESEGNSDQQSVELGMDWEFANDQMLALGTQFEVDGDDEGPDWGVSVSYIIEFAGPRLDSK